MKKLFIALATVLTADAAFACDTQPAETVTFEDVAIGSYTSLYVPGRVIIPESAGRSFFIEQAESAGDCPSIAGRHLVMPMSGDKPGVISFHAVTHHARTVSFDYAKLPGTTASVIVTVGGQPAGEIDLSAPSGHFAFEAPEEGSVNNLIVVARQSEGDGGLRIDNVLLR